MNINSKLNIAPTAALVLYFAKDIFNKGIGHKYLDKINFENAQDLIDKINQISPHFSNLLLYRKQIIRSLIKEKIQKYSQSKIQICILAAGLDPLGLQIAEQYSSNISIYEIDNHYMEEKEVIYKDLYTMNNHIFTIKCNIHDHQSLKQKIEDKGFSNKKITLLILEGILHYMSKEEWIKLIYNFKTSENTIIGIMDYGIPIPDVPEEFKEETKNIISIVEKATNMPFQFYNRKSILNMLTEINVLEKEIYGVPLIEYNENYLKNNSCKGINGATMEICLFKV